MRPVQAQGPVLLPLLQMSPLMGIPMVCYQARHQGPIPALREMGRGANASHIAENNLLDWDPWIDWNSQGLQNGHW